ncbi:Fur family transcriptional regulator [Maritalea sp.]|uniref:Fur family transcriptional regulator n=1 Tax=Maritalea sp. TaxID=2003361 RepID=UPI003EF629D3
MASKHNLTKNQSLVFDRLVASAVPMSAYDLLDELRGNGLKAPLQIYRALEKLQEFDLVHRLESMNSFVACTGSHYHGADAGFVAFAICEACGNVSEFSDEIVQNQLMAWSKERQFSPHKTSLEIRGLCAACA